MKELYGEGLATHTDPESCAGPHKGQAKRSTGAHAGRATEPRKQSLLGVDAVTRGGRQHVPVQDGEHGAAWRGPRTRGPGRQRAGCMRGISMRENREVP